MMSFYQSFVEQKIKTAQAITAGCCQCTYVEGSLILCSIISAMSAIAWPGDKIDKKRFVEIIISFPNDPPRIDPTKVSAPLLVQDGKACNSTLGISDKSLYLTEANDLNEKNVMKSCPGLRLSEIRKYSYAHLLYEQIRCGFVHQYRPGDKASDHDSLRQIAKIPESDISYLNKIKDNKTYRVIYFPLKWIVCVAEGVARGLDVELSKKGKMPFDNLCLGDPTPWWIEGEGR
jgi:hypothetical protein